MREGQPHQLNRHDSLFEKYTCGRRTAIHFQSRYPMTNQGAVFRVMDLVY